MDLHLKMAAFSDASITANSTDAISPARACTLRSAISSTMLRAFAAPRVLP
jgi:hypothetical protein